MMTNYPFTDPGGVFGVVIKAAHLTDLRTALNQARSELGLGPLAFTDPSPAGLPVKRIHITELQAGLQ